jgi:hypothetical protein
MLHRAAAIALSLVLLLTPLASRAQDNVHRCLGSDGQMNFTDRACTDDQVPQTAPSPQGPGAAGKPAVVARSCASNRNDLLSDVRDALASHDVNRLASRYLWTGMGTREAYARMDRFGVVSARPLVDAQLVDGMMDGGSDHIRIDQLHSTTNSETETSIFQVVPAAGCVWIHD